MPTKYSKSTLVEPTKYSKSTLVEIAKSRLTGLPRKISASQRKQCQRIRQALEVARSKAYALENRKVPTFNDLFNDMDKEFSWEGEPEDVGNAWSCDDSSCATGWHISVQYVDMGRKDGKTWYLIYEDSIAGDGDYQPVAGWDEREGDVITQDVLDDLWFHEEGRMVDHFYGWGMYYLDCAETGEDPLKTWRYAYNIMSPEDAIAAAKDNLKDLRK
jgi:hypothetical protein